jgi:tRNA-specific 2-thiouridylase
LSKNDARQAARENELAVADKKESQEICFVPDGDYAGFIDRYLEAEAQTDRLPRAGEIVTSSGKVIGAHNGIHRYTIGQRRGIGIAQSRPLYVLGINPDKKQVIVGHDDELLTSEFTAAGVNWIAFANPGEPVRAEVRIRYRHTPTPGRITPMKDDRVNVTFDEPQRAVTPGQATVFYRGDEVLGGGWISKTVKANSPSDFLGC